MPTRKIAEASDKRCYDPDHSPPTMRVFEPGTYEHECPTCHFKTVFTVRQAIT